MLFNSLFFFLTLIPVLVLHVLLAPTHNRISKAVVLAYSLFFYAMWNPWFLGLLVGTTCIDYAMARLMEAHPGYKRLFLAVSVCSNLGVLGTFKYFNFFARAATTALIRLHLPVAPPVLDVVLPVGLSFYTFEALSYTIDVYRGRLAARHSLLDVALFVSYFPHLVAGPIVRARQLMPQFERSPRLRLSAALDGGVMILMGLFLKTVIADSAAPMVGALFTSSDTNGPIQNWTAAMLFGVQIYGDFAGYSLVAIGLARVMGYTIPQNFRHPYAALGFSDFWQRWHISLSSWLRDYLYIPMGGNRKGSVRTYANLLATMLLGGLWHGATGTFVLWGGIHGAFLCVERCTQPWLSRRFPGTTAATVPRLPRFAGQLATFLLVSVTWIPFRAQSFGISFAMVKGLVIGPWRTDGSLTNSWLLILGVLLFDLYWARRNLLATVARNWPTRVALTTALTASLVFLGSTTSAPFIYFQF